MGKRGIPSDGCNALKRKFKSLEPAASGFQNKTKEKEGKKWLGHRAKN